jgi:geranylgeranyl diphosphate synthase type I
MNLNQFSGMALPEVEKTLIGTVQQAYPADCESLRGMLAYHMGWEGSGAGPEAQGKRIRPLLVLLTAQAAGGDWHPAVPAAAAVELIHNFSLIHDDIQDQSPLRRGRATLYTMVGVAQAINAGDSMFSLAQLAMLGLNSTCPPAVVVEAVRCLNETCLRLTQGQYLDISFETRANLTIDEYWSMIGGKTAALLAACAGLGALTGGASTGTQELAREYGRSLGLAFQVLDDYLGIWGEASLTGKSVESDLVTRKKTLPVLFGLQNSKEFARRWEQPITAADVGEVAALLTREGARDYTLETADRLTSQSMQSLAEAFPDTAALLQDLSTRLLKRQS